MKPIKKISNDEMVNMFPDLMSALSSPDADYCWGDCDGLRIFKDGICTVCGSPNIWEKTPQKEIE